MSRNLKFGAAAGLLLALAACKAEGDQPGFIVTPGMFESVPYDAYAENPTTGQTLRHPPQGTVPHGKQIYLHGPGRAEVLRAKSELKNPYPADSEGLKRGKHMYETFCAVCHGPGGQGDGPIIGRFPNPPSLLARAKDFSDGMLFYVITYGQGIMAPYAVQVPARDRWLIIHHLRTLQGIDPGASPDATKAADDAAAKAAAGGAGGAAAADAAAGGASAEAAQGGGGDAPDDASGGAGGSGGAAQAAPAASSATPATSAAAVTPPVPKRPILVRPAAPVEPPAPPPAATVAPAAPTPPPKSTAQPGAGFSQPN